MPNIKTDLSVSPYYDDYNRDKQFHRILFKPSVAIQARELTQLQTILQEQIRRFGTNIYKEGTIIDGCNFTYNAKFDYVKIRDVQSNGVSIVLSDYKGCIAVGESSNVYAVVNSTASGLVSQAPNLSTLYLEYFGTGLSDKKVFDVAENITLYRTSVDANNIVAVVTAAGDELANSATAVGKGFAVSCSEGVIFSKGHFINVDKNFVVVSKYHNEPYNVSVGFDVSESIVNSDADTSLLDNAQGYNNENAPGADRLKLTPTLVAINTGDALANADFMSIMDFQAGRPVLKRTTTQYNKLNDEMARRTKEESGNYTVKVNTLGAETIRAPASAYSNVDSNNIFEVVVGPGLHYVNGYRAEQHNTSRIPNARAIATANVASSTVSMSMGGYIIVDEFKGNFSPEDGTTVDLKDTAGDYVSTPRTISVSHPGTTIGTARIKAITWHEGSPGYSASRFKVYLFDVKMNSGKTFKDVRSISVASTAHADIVIDNDAGLNATIYERQLSNGLYRLPVSGLKTTTQHSFIFRTTTTTGSASGSPRTATGTMSAPAPYSNPLSRDEKREFVVIPTSSGGNYTAYVPVNTDDITIEVSGTTLTLTNLDTSYSGAFKVYHNASATSSSPREKRLKEVYVKVYANSVSTNTYSLGMPDVKSLSNVYVAPSGTAWADVEDTAYDVTSSWILNTRSFKNRYGLSSITKRASLSLSTDDLILVKCKVFEAQSLSVGSNYYTAASYKDADGNVLNPKEIPLFRNEDNGNLIDLRNVLDVRPQADAIADTSATILTSATIMDASNQALAANDSFSGSDLYLAAPNKTFTADLTYYLPRIDKVIITEQGYLQIVHGTPSSKPVPPPTNNGSMTIGIINIPPYPSLTPAEATATERLNEGITITAQSTKRFTMKDIGDIEKRINALEYYTTLSALEMQAADTIVTDQNGNDRFKSGILVDPASNFKIADTSDPEFRVGLEPSLSEYIPSFTAFDFQLKLSSNTGCIEHNGVTMIDAQEFLIIDQPIATNYRFCSENFYKYYGNLSISPDYDGGYDPDAIPTKSVNVDVDLGQAVDSLFEAFPNSFPQTYVVRGDQIGSSSSTSYAIVDEITETVDVDRSWQYTYNGTTYNYDSSNWYWWGNGDYEKTTKIGVATETSITEYEAIKYTTAKGEDSINKQKVGDFVSDVQFQPYMRAKEINIVGTGFRPNTKHYFFFDDQDVNAYITPGAPKNVVSLTSFNFLGDTPQQVKKAGQIGTDGYVTSDSNGRIYAIFSLPAETFYVGERILTVLDVAAIDAKDDATSKATAKYNAFNFSVEKSDVSLSTRTPTWDVTTENIVDKETTISSEEYTAGVTKTYTYDTYWGETTAKFETEYSPDNGTTVYNYEYKYGNGNTYKYTNTIDSSLTGANALSSSGNYNNYGLGYYGYYGIGIGYGYGLTL